MDMTIHIITFHQITSWIAHHKEAIVVIWLAIIKVMTAVQDAVDAMPKDLKPPFGKIIYLMQAVGPYLLYGNRVKPIGGQDAKITDSSAAVRP